MDVTPNATLKVHWSASPVEIQHDKIRIGRKQHTVRLHVFGATPRLCSGKIGLYQMLCGHSQGFFSDRACRSKGSETNNRRGYYLIDPAKFSNELIRDVHAALKGNNEEETQLIKKATHLSLDQLNEMMPEVMVWFAQTTKEMHGPIAPNFYTRQDDTPTEHPENSKFIFSINWDDGQIKSKCLEIGPLIVEHIYKRMGFVFRSLLPSEGQLAPFRFSAKELEKLKISLPTADCAQWAFLWAGVTQARDVILQKATLGVEFSNLFKLLEEWGFRSVPQKDIACGDLAIYFWLDTKAPTHVAVLVQDTEQRLVVLSKPGFRAKKPIEHPVFDATPAWGDRVVFMRRSGKGKEKIGGQT